MLERKRRFIVGYLARHDFDAPGENRAAMWQDGPGVYRVAAYIGSECVLDQEHTTSRAAAVTYRRALDLVRPVSND